MNVMIEAVSHYGLNQWIWTEEYFYEICEKELIFYSEIKKKFSFWASIDGESHICVSRNLKGTKRLYVMMHELGHHFLSAGENLDQIHFYNKSRSKYEFEADAFALLALCPLTVLQGKEEFEEIDPFARKIRKERERLNFLYKR